MSCAFDVISPARTTWPSFTSTSHATRACGSCARWASRIESAMKSHTLSGCPSLTLSDEKMYVVACAAGAGMCGTTSDRLVGRAVVDIGRWRLVWCHGPLERERPATDGRGPQWVAT